MLVVESHGQILGHHICDARIVACDTALTLKRYSLPISAASKYGVQDVGGSDAKNTVGVGDGVGVGVGGSVRDVLSIWLPPNEPTVDAGLRV